MIALLVFVAVVTGVFGLVIGSFLNVVAYRVPAGISLLRESRCPTCSAPVRPWQNVPVLSWLILRGRCAGCRTPISVRYPIVELLSGLVFAGVGVWWALSHELTVGPLGANLAILAAYLWFAASGVVLTVIDFDTRRLPHVITTTTFFVCLALLALACVLGADWGMLARAACGAGGLFAFYALLRLIRPDGMGGGDVRLAASVGLMLAWIGWWPLAFGAFAAFMLGGVFGIALMARGRAGRRSAIPFGPWIIAGAWVGIVAGETLGAWYASLLGGLS